MKRALQVAGWVGMKVCEWFFALLALLFLLDQSPLWFAGCFGMAFWIAYDNRLPTRGEEA